MPDQHYTDPRLASLYDFDSPWGPDRQFYLELSAPSPKRILDIGCGTGLLSSSLAALGHEVTACDPAEAMLEVARARPSGDRVNWILGTAQDSISFSPFDLSLMTGNAIQALLTPDDLTSLFDSVRTGTQEEGGFIFESRNPDLDWPSRWDYSIDLETPQGKIKESRTFSSLRDGVMHFQLNYQFPDEEITTESRIRFWGKEEILDLLRGSGLQVDRVEGDYKGSDFNPGDHSEMIFFVSPI